MEEMLEKARRDGRIEGWTSWTMDGEQNLPDTFLKAAGWKGTPEQFRSEMERVRARRGAGSGSGSEQ